MRTRSSSDRRAHGLYEPPCYPWDMPSESGVAAETENAASGAAPSRTATSEVAESERPTDGDGLAVDVDPIEWGPVRYDRIRSLAAGFGIVLGGALLALVAVVVAGAGSALIADGPAGLLARVTPENAFLFGALALAAAVTLVPYAYLARRESTFESDLLRGGRLGRSSLRPAWVLAGAAVPCVAWWVGPSWLRSTAFALVPLVWLIPMLVMRAGTVVRLDPSDGVVERTDVAADRTRTDDLESVVRTRRIDLPWTDDSLFLLAFRGNAWYRSTPWLFVPRALADEAETAFDAVLERGEGPDRASVPERVVLAVVGSSSLVFGIVMAVATGEGTAGAVLALLTTPFSLVFLALAARL